MYLSCLCKMCTEESITGVSALLLFTILLYYTFAESFFSTNFIQLGAELANAGEVRELQITVYGFHFPQLHIF